MLKEETIYFYFEGQEEKFLVQELNDGLWRIVCHQDVFRKLNGGSTIERVACVSEALEKIGLKNTELANAMLEPFGKICKEVVTNFCGWLRDRRVYFHWN